MNNKVKGLYEKGQQVYVNKLYILGETIEVKTLDTPIIAKIKEVHERCSEPFGVPYVLELPADITDKNNCAKVCYWESDILCKVEEDEELIWKIWGDQ